MNILQWIFRGSFAFWMIAANQSFGQNTIIHWKDHIPEKQLCCDPPGITGSFEDWEQWEKQIANDFRDAGYLAFSIDSVSLSNDSPGVWLYAGPEISFAKISIKQIPLDFWSHSGLSPDTFSQTLGMKDIIALFDKLENYYHQIGHPFAYIKLQIDDYLNGIINATIVPQPGQYYTFAPLEIDDPSIIRSAYLYQLSSYFPGEAYSEEKVISLINQLSKLSFVKQTKEASLSFYNGQAILKLYLEKIKVSSFDGILGILPSQKTDEKLQIAGQLQLSLVNGFQQGENIHLQWARPSSGIQRLFVNASYPFLFGSPLGINADIELFKNDTFYLNFKHRWELNSLLKKGIIMGLFISFSNSNVLGLNTDVIAGDSLLTGFNKKFAGLKLSCLSDVFLPSPKDGYALGLSFGLGSSSYKNKNTLSDEGQKLKKSQYFIEMSLLKNFPFSNRSTCSFQLVSSMLSGTNLYSNELYRLGGLNNFRGFHEESLLASAYFNCLAEYRFFIENNSYLALSANGGWLESKQTGNYKKFFPYGLSAGIVLSTRAGILNFYYAMGFYEWHNEAMRQSGIHFGLKNYF